MLGPRFFLAVAVLADGFDALAGAAVGVVVAAVLRRAPGPGNEFYPRGFKDANDGGDVLIISADRAVAGLHSLDRWYGHARSVRQFLLIQPG
jgi:divalent metal cation (Fe/Co/Zn/Cd) transporter